MNKSRGQSGIKTGRYALFALIALVLPVCVNMLRANIDVVGAVGERVAAFAAMVNMPGEGLAILRERFREELYPQWEEDAAYLPAAVPLPVPGLPSTQEGSEPQSPESESRAPSPGVQPRIPARYQAMLVSENFAGAEGGQNLRYGAGLIRNDTGLGPEEINEILSTPCGITFEDTDEPQVLIYHTHATEAFEKFDSEVYDTRNTWRSSDNNSNMVAVGAAMAQVLEGNGIGVIHDTTQHDYPSYNGSYERSAETVSAYLDMYPGIKVVLDLHRDAMERENAAIIKPVAEIQGEKAAQIMIISGCDNGTMGMPNWRENLRFAAALQDAMESEYPQLTRPVLFSYRKYNQHLSTGGLLLEFGSNANTLDEAVYAATLAGQALADLIREHTM